jgi:hypothetical protein
MLLWLQSKCLFTSLNKLNLPLVPRHSQASVLKMKTAIEIFHNAVHKISFEEFVLLLICRHIFTGRTIKMLPCILHDVPKSRLMEVLIYYSYHNSYIILHYLHFTPAFPSLMLLMHEFSIFKKASLNTNFSKKM